MNENDVTFLSPPPGLWSALSIDPTFDWALSLKVSARVSTCTDKNNVEESLLDNSRCQFTAKKSEATV